MKALIVLIFLFALVGLKAQTCASLEVDGSISAILLNNLNAQQIDVLRDAKYAQKTNEVIKCLLDARDGAEIELNKEEIFLARDFLTKLDQNKAEVKELNATLFHLTNELGVQ